jgi:hypothetical protein
MRLPRPQDRDPGGLFARHHNDRPWQGYDLACILAPTFKRKSFDRNTGALISRRVDIRLRVGVSAWRVQASCLSSVGPPLRLQELHRREAYVI